GHGILLSAGATDNFIGGAALAFRNVVSGNQNDGILLTGAGTANNAVAGNYVGTDAAGTAALPNRDDGLLVSPRARNNTIGGTGADLGNLISGSLHAGVHLTGAGTAGNVVAGNRIGTDRDGTAALANMQQGVLIDGGAANNTVGGT